MTEYIQSVRRDIMRRVYVIFFLRTVVKPFAVKAASLVVLAAVGTAFVSVRNIVHNMPAPAEIAAFAKFFFSAFLHTHFAVQALSLALGVLAVLAARDIARAAKFFSVPRRAYIARASV